MFALLKQTRTGFYIAMIGLLFMSVISPVLALAQAELTPGDDAVATEDTRLYSDSSRDADIKAEVTEDTPVEILDGPFTEEDDSIWYWVKVWDLEGYMAEVDLEGIEPTADAPAPTDESTDNAAAEEEAPALPWKEPIGFAVAYDNVTCRADAGTGAPEITVVAAGRTVEITGAEVWVDGVSWTPVNCENVGGFISTEFLGAEAPDEAVAEAPAAEEVVEETVTEEVAAAEQQVAEAEQQVQEQVAAAEEQVAAAEQQVEETVAEVTAGPWLPPIGTLVATDAVTCRVDVSTSAGEIMVVAPGATVEITGAELWAEGISWTPVNCAGVGGFIATQYLGQPEVEAAEVPAEQAAPVETEVVTEEAPAAPVETEVVTEAAPVVEQTEVATEEAPAEAPAEVTETAPVEETVAAESTPAPADETVAEETVAVEATPAPAEGEATEPAAAPTEEVVEEATQEATAEPQEEQLAIQGQAVEETESTSPVDDSAIVGTAEVRGTNGSGVACRTAPDSGAAVIRVLPEGMNVLVLSAPDANGWMSIVCSDQVGYAQSAYLYSGGAASDFTASGSSYGTVSATGGTGLNCRSGPGLNYSVIGYFPAGSGVNVRGAAQGDWVPVICGGSEGWVHGDFLVPASAPSGSTNTGSTTGQTATVVGTNDDGLRCRTAPNGSIITVMAEGTTVGVRGAAEGSWLPITCAGQAGYASTQYLSVGGGTSGGDTSAPAPSSGTVTVTGTGGSRLNCRSGAGTSFSIVTSVAEGTVLNVRGAAENGWLPVSCNGANAWVSTMFVTAGGTAPAPDSGSGNTGSPSPTTGTATVVGTNGDGLRCRTAPNGSIITVMAEGTSVGVRGAEENGWLPIVCAGQNGYASSQYLSVGGSAPAPTPAPSQPSGFANGDHAKTTDNLNLRYEPNSGAGVATYAPAGTVVLITGGHAGNGYYPVNWDGLKGYMHGDYMVKTSEPLSERGGSAAPTDPPTSGGGSSATGNAIVDYALGYEGYPYVWATHGPYSFDCSGFVYWVIKNVVGKDVGYGLWTQVNAGTPVAKSDLQPGDIVFFQNTYKAGLSHDGIYIGGGKFIHAQNEDTGVVISDLNSNYYGSRWYGATRIR